MPSWVNELFNTEWPVVGMAHLPALPGTPRYEMQAGIAHLIEHVRADVEALEQGGVHAIMYCNEDDRPYVFEAGIEQVATMTRVVTETKPESIPFGIDFLWDPMAAMAIAYATSAYFIREVLTGTYESDMGLWSPSAGKVARFRRQIGADNIRAFFNVVPEFASPLGDRTAAQRARSAAVSCLADVILISGPMAGSEPDAAIFNEIKAAVGDVPVFLNTGAKVDNIADYVEITDGVIVGSSLKIDGYTWNRIDIERVRSFMEAVHTARSGLK